MKKKIMIVDDEPDMLEACEDVLRRLPLKITTEIDPLNAIKILREDHYDMVIADLKMPGLDGLGLIESLRDISPQTITCIITSYPTIESAVEAVKLGAFDYLAKPFSPDQLRLLVQKALHHQDLLRENSFLHHQMEKPYKFGNMIGTSPPMQKIFHTIEKVAQSPVEVLITGESGTGKELVARKIHKQSGRKGNFVAVDCGAIPENLLESEFFGVEKGAYTGATAPRMGLIEFANQGSLFLDELCELSLNLQAKLLRVFQEHTLRRLGGKKDIPVDGRILAATNRHIETEVKMGRFREDLFYRIHVLKIELPPLRERPEDIPHLVNHFLSLYAEQMNRNIEGIGEDAMEVLLNYLWPGNVRELQNVIKRAVVLAEKEVIQTLDLPENMLEIQGGRTNLSDFFNLREKTLGDFERKYLISLLKKYQGEITRAIKEAKIPRASFYRLLKKYSIKPETFRTSS